ncbi:SKN1-domain-containing protein [Exidia glandulosa HHB12029]|uniref:SKN1-domain-containing protein n=1 Tax=Exidia glandulosa HHB12029 TaxID=1314781 RepID=A0A165I866_EXIGL|nr:SKN1-domain-containing protein [Exidia glandulosa HHB12029]
MSPSTADMHSTFVPTMAQGGSFVPSRTAYDPAESNFGRDPDDALHEPDPPGYKYKSGPSVRGCGNVLTIAILVAAIVGLFMGYPLADWISHGGIRKLMSSNIFVNGTGQAAVLATIPKLIDPATPDTAKTRTGFDGFEYELVFSDEFEVPDRSFYPGDDPFWEAQDIWYGATKDLEWYDPSQVTTGDGKLRIKLELSDPTINHNLTMKSGMLTGWNKFCFSSGYIEISAQLPGAPMTAGYWPGAWLLGNLGRAGYGASTDGLWPYAYDSCDVGVMPNQTNAEHTEPIPALGPLPDPYGRPDFNRELSWLPGQRLSACTCKGEDHPGPWLEKEGRYRGRGSPEIDIIEAQKCKRRGPLAHQCVSQSAQFAPFSNTYNFDPIGTEIHSPEKTERNQYHGSALQQSVSCITNVSDSTMADGELGGGFGLFGFEYFADPDDPSQSYVTWISDGEKSHTVRGTSVGPDASVGVGQRLVAPEPMFIILNLGVSSSFQTVDMTAMTFPSYFLIDYVRVYQRKGSSDSAIGCDPPEYPTSKYIEDHLDVYMNPNLSFWSQTSYTVPLNKMRNPGSC